MASSPNFRSPFAPLHLSCEAQSQLCELSEMFVCGAVTNYEQYIHQDKHQLDPTKWKFLKQQDDVRVYCERRHTHTNHDSTSSFSSSGDGASLSNPSLSENEEDLYDVPETPVPGRNTAALPVMLTVGTLTGDLMDTMYGVANATLDMKRIKTSYVEDAVVNAAVLATIREPTPQDPFQSLSVRWAIKGQPLHIRTLVKNRDMVLLESTGLTQLPSTGEVVGYQLIHSVTFPETPPLADSLRGNVSICALYRQHDDNTVDVYVRGFLDPTGRIMRALVVKSATVVMLSVGRNIVCAHLKKLAYALRRRHTPALENSTYDERLQLRVAYKKKKEDTTTCAICAKGLSSLAPLTFGRKRLGTQCRLCLQHVCAKCTVTKKLSAISPQDHGLYQTNVAFCLECVTAVTQANAFEIARDEVAQNDAALGYGRPNASSTSSSTNGSSGDAFDDGESPLNAVRQH